MQYLDMAPKKIIIFWERAAQKRLYKSVTVNWDDCTFFVKSVCNTVFSECVQIRKVFTMYCTDRAGAVYYLFEDE